MTGEQNEPNEPKEVLPTDPPPKGTAPGGVSWQDAFSEAVTTRDKIKQDYKAVQAELNVYKEAERVRQQDAESAQEKTKRERMESEGKYHEALKTVEDKAKAEVEKTRRTVAERLIPMAIKSAAAKIPNLATESIDDLPSLLRDRISLDPETMEVFVKGADGKPLVDERLTPVPVEKFISDWVGTKPYLLIDTLPMRHGQRPGAGRKFSIEQAVNDTAMYESWKAEDPDGLAAAEKAYWSPQAAKARIQAQHKSHG